MTDANSGFDRDTPATRSITWNAFGRPIDWNLASILSLFPALVVVMLTARFENGITPDSIRYLEAAGNLIQFGYFGDKFLYWPPLYPVLLSMHVFTPIDANAFAMVMGRLSELVTLLGLWALARRLIDSARVLGIMLFVCASGLTFQQVFHHTWSETLYVPLCIWTVFFWMRYLSRGAQFADLLPPCFLLSLALLTRHVGIVMACAMGMSCLLARNMRPVDRLVAISAIGVASIPYCIWGFRTWLLSGSFAGPREPLANPDMWRQLDLFGGVLGHWLLPHFYFESGGRIVAIAFLFLLALCLLLGLMRNATSKRKNDAAATKLFYLTICLLFALGHCLLTVISAYRYFLDVNERTLFPVLWVVLLAVAIAVERIQVRLAMRGKKWELRIFALALTLYLTFWFTAPNASMEFVLRLAANG